MHTTVRHLLSIADLTDTDLTQLIERGGGFAARSPVVRSLAGAMAGIFFSTTSTRTRTAFSAGAARLGAQTVAYGPGDLQLNTGESVEDTGRVLAGMLDLLVVRTAGDPAELRALAAQDRMAVVNAMTVDEHPTQALSDLTTLMVHFGRIEGLKVLYVGEGNNTATALTLALTRFPGVELELRTPEGYGVPEAFLSRGAEQAARYGASVVQRHDMAGLGGFDVVYTTRWQTTGTSKPDPDWRRAFAPFQVTAELWRTSPDAVFLHDLPAHRGEEVTADVLDGPASIAFRQARTKLASAMAVLEWCRPGFCDGAR
ncbi:ornithine carbamoyltransferase [Amycolatopsis samaneae]|uniref:Ornithine carbamoyltransferase n=1 Tax=Amycolatopsis samaneae TaxID=664691 RepID=A0ABW5GPC1_9PSEU